MIEKECLEKGISPIEWIERYAKEYRQKDGMMNKPKIGLFKKEGVRQ